jgi:hypothetical protein
VEKAQREAILRQGVVLPETPRQRRELAALAEDLESIPLAGKPLPVRARAFRPNADAYLVATQGPLPCMVRLREIERLTAAHELELRDAWWVLADTCGENAEQFGDEWLAAARSCAFDEVNDLIERHNRWYPAESRLPMDPRTGEYALVNGRDYRLVLLDATWILERFPAALGEARRGPRSGRL